MSVKNKIKAGNLFQIKLDNIRGLQLSSFLPVYFPFSTILLAINDEDHNGLTTCLYNKERYVLNTGLLISNKGIELL